MGMADTVTVISLPAPIARRTMSAFPNAVRESTGGFAPTMANADPIAAVLTLDDLAEAGIAIRKWGA